MTQSMSAQTRARRTNGSYAQPTPRRGRRHVLDLDDFSVQEIEEVFQNADAMREVMNREIKKVPTLRGKTVIYAFHRGKHSHPGVFRASGQDPERRRH